MKREREKATTKETNKVKLNKNERKVERTKTRERKHKERTTKEINQNRGRRKYIKKT